MCLKLSTQCTTYLPSRKIAFDETDFFFNKKVAHFDAFAPASTKVSVNRMLKGFLVIS